MSIKREHVLIVGGSKGIGKVIAEQFAKNRKTVSVIGRTLPNNNNKKNPRYLTCDLLDQTKLKQTLAYVLKKYGKISTLVFSQRFRDTTDNWQGELNLTLTTTKFIIDTLMPNFSHKASIVIINSVANQAVLPGQSLGYHVAKAGLIQLVRYLAVTLGPKGIRINSVSPATVMKDEAKDFYLKEKTTMQLFSDVIPLGRMATPIDIFGAVSFFSSDNSAYITGQNLTVDGGYYLLSQESLTRTYGKK